MIFIVVALNPEEIYSSQKRKSLEARSLGKYAREEDSLFSSSLSLAMLAED